MSYSAYILTETSRDFLLQRFKPMFPEVIAHHITFCFPDKGPPPEVSVVEVIGYANDDRIECLIAQLDGETERPSGGTYHITLSLDRAQGAKPVHSNGLIKKGWQTLEKPLKIEVTAELVMPPPRTTTSK